MPDLKVTNRRVKVKRKTNSTPKALDYAYGCLNGELKCFNTHGETDPDNWTPVHNMNNCVGTHVPDCSGGRQRNPNSPDIFDYVVVENVGKNRVDSFGVIVRNDETEDRYLLDKNAFTLLTGVASRNSVNGRRVFRPFYLTGTKLFDYNLDLYKVPSSSLSAAKTFLKSFGQDSLVYFVEFLDFNGVNVRDNNDLTEVFTKYLAFTQPNYQDLNADYANQVSRFYQARSTGDYIPMEKSMSIGGFDIGGILSGAIGLIMEGVTMINNEAIRRELIEWLNWFNNQMQIDMNDLVTFRAEKGPRFAADYITNLENTSWKDIRNYITRWCSMKGVTVPPEIKVVFDNFAALKVRWIAEAQNPGSNPSYTPQPTAPPSGAPNQSGLSTGALIGLGLGAAVLIKLLS